MCSSSGANVNFLGAEHHEGVEDGNAITGFVHIMIKAVTPSLSADSEFVHVPGATCTYMCAKNDLSNKKFL